MEPSGGSTTSVIEHGLRRHKRPLYAVILFLISVQALMAGRLLGTDLEDYVRYGVSGMALASAVLILFVPRLFRFIEIGVFLVGSFVCVAFLSVALDGSSMTSTAAVRVFTIWLAVLIVWAFLAFRSGLALTVSALLLLFGVGQVGLHLLVANPLPLADRQISALADLLLVGLAYLLLLFGLTNSIERRTAALASEETAARILSLDPLTGITNRAAFHRLHQDMTRGRGAKPFSLVLIDLDDFRSINERFGTATGDDVLRAAALRLANTVGPDAHVLARLGGDVFGLIVNGALQDDAAAELVAQVSAAFQAPFTAGGGPLQVTATVGISRYPADAATQTEQVTQAEMAVARAKQKGEAYELASHSAFEHGRTALARDLREALGKGELQLYFQPIGTVLKADDEQGATVAVNTVETLLRWNHPDRGVLPPHEFVPLAERAGLIVSIGNWVLSAACQQVRQWEDAGHGAFHVSVNVSPHQFTEPGLVESIQRALRSAALDPHRLVIEVTETSADLPTVERRLAEIRRLGVRVAIDDFGAGYSSLGRLRNLPIDFVKLDRSFVRGLDGTDVRARLVVRAAVVLAHGLGARVVAEGIESDSQAVAAVSIGCDYLQGFLLAPPTPPATFTSVWSSGDVVSWHNDKSVTDTGSFS